jgi:hypothetical protein
MTTEFFLDRARFPFVVLICYVVDDKTDLPGMILLRSVQGTVIDSLLHVLMVELA